MADELEIGRKERLKPGPSVNKNGRIEWQGELESNDNRISEEQFWEMSVLDSPYSAIKLSDHEGKIRFTHDKAARIMYHTKAYQMKLCTGLLNYTASFFIKDIEFITNDFAGKTILEANTK